MIFSELLKRLEALDPSHKVPFGWCKGGAYTVSEDEENYEHLGFTVQEDVTIGDMVEELKFLLGKKMFSTNNPAKSVEITVNTSVWFRGYPMDQIVIRSFGGFV